ncbi:hypothetical protein [Burkholderia pyrrocinia]|uniref:hypothetical protein n=1 Tax=Burkholderia pyrrocinia TaxID=60550 RepID=UPI002AB27E4D|nr:hypothetical protein [Burkholderia pyrrocinia]
MVTNHYEDGLRPVVHVMTVIDDFGRQWTLVPDDDYFGRYDYAPAMAAIAFELSGGLH